MTNQRGNRKVDTKEFELPETMFVRDIENRVFQSIAYECVSKIEGIALAEGNFLDNLLTRDGFEGLKAIRIDQDNNNHSVTVKIEINILYGYSIPSKAEEIQTKVAEEITRLTGLHVSGVHVVFKNMVAQLPKRTHLQRAKSLSGAASDYNDEF